VDHCSRAFGLVINHSEWKLVYSGDTVPCPALIEAGNRATVLIHEATFEDGMEAEATEKRHSTISQAVQVGLGMQAKHVILTHFSQRYPKLPPTILQAHRVCVAFDLMEISFDRFDHVAGLFKDLQAALDEVLDGEQKEDSAS